MKTTVRNLQNGTEDIFINDYSVVENIVNAILIKMNQTGQITDAKTRRDIIEKHELRQFCSKNGLDYICFCEDFELLSRQPIGDKINKPKCYSWD